MMVAQVCDLAPGDFVHTLGDAHLYVNHQQQADLQLQREPLALPTLKINPAVKDLFAFRFEDFELRSEEHTSELQSLMRISYAVFCLKKKKKTDAHKVETTKRHRDPIIVVYLKKNG